VKIPEAGTDLQQVIVAVKIVQAQPIREDVVALQAANAVLDEYPFAGLLFVLSPLFSREFV